LFINPRIIFYFVLLKQVQYEFATQKDIGSEDLSKKFKHRLVIGCIGISKSGFKNNRSVSFSEIIVRKL